MNNTFIDNFLDIVDMIEYLERKKEESKNKAVKEELERQIRYLERQLRDMNDLEIPKEEISNDFDKFTFDKHINNDIEITTSQENDNDSTETNSQYEKIDDFKNGLAKVKLNNKYGFVDKNDNLVIEII